MKLIKSFKQKLQQFKKIEYSKQNEVFFYKHNLIQFSLKDLFNSTESRMTKEKITKEVRNISFPRSGNKTPNQRRQ